MNRRLKLTVWAAGLALGCGVNQTLAALVTYTNLDDFLEAAGDVREIDFETLPDGSPTEADVLITPEFNYTAQGVEFFPHTELLFIGGNPISGFNLVAGILGSGGPRNWMIAEFVTPATAVGILFGGGRTLSVYSEEGFLTSRVFGGSGGPFFLGLTSDAPMITAIIDDGRNRTAISSFFFAPVPEPATAVLLAVGGLWLFRRSGRIVRSSCLGRGIGTRRRKDL